MLVPVAGGASRSIGAETNEPDGCRRRRSLARNTLVPARERPTGAPCCSTSAAFQALRLHAGGVDEPGGHATSIRVQLTRKSFAQPRPGPPARISPSSARWPLPASAREARVSVSVAVHVALESYSRAAPNSAAIAEHPSRMRPRPSAAQSARELRQARNATQRSARASRGEAAPCVTALGPSEARGGH